MPLADDGCFEHYEIVRRADGCFDQLGHGAMGVTYRALDTVLGHTVALKVIDAGIANRADARERFLWEARAAARFGTRTSPRFFITGCAKATPNAFTPWNLWRVKPFTVAIEEGRTLTHEGLHKLTPADSRAVTCSLPARLGPEKISITRLPVTAREVFGREEDLAFLETA